MNEFLEKNLACINRYNKNLVQKIASVKKLPENLVLCQNPNQEYNLQYDGDFIHSTNGAQNEADKIVSAISQNATSLFVLFGLGLGYLFETLCSKTSNKVILYEDNIELLRAVFELVDFSSVLQKENVILVTDFVELKDAYFSLYTPQLQPAFVCLDFYKRHYPDKINLLIKEINNANEIANGTFHYKVKNNHRLAQSVIENLDKKILFPCINTLNGKFKNLPAVVVSAGASLYKNLEFLKQNQNKVIIYCVGNVYKTLREYGIKPDFVCIIEERYIEYQVDNIKTEDVNLIAAPTAFSKLFDYKFKNVFMYPSKENSVNSWYTQLVNQKETVLEGRGTVSYTALFSAYLAGCNPIVLIGQDLAYVDDCCYSQNSTYSSLKCRQNNEGRWEVYCENENELANKLFAQGTFSREIILNGIKNKIKIMSDQLMVAKNQNGGDIRTDISFTYFAQYFSDFTKKYGQNLTLINSSTGGLNIDGYQNLPFEEVCKKYFIQNVDISNFVDEVKEIKPDTETIKNNIEKESNSLKKLSQEIQNNFDVINMLQKQIIKYNKPLVTTNLALQNALSLYDKITCENSSKIYFYLMYKEQIELDEALKTSELTLPVIVNLCKLLNDFFEKSQFEITNVLQKLEKAKEVLNESSCATC